MNRRLFLLLLGSLISAGGMITAPVVVAPNNTNALYAQEDAQYYFKLGVNLIKENKLDEAIEAFRKSIQLNPNEAKTHYNLGVVYQKLGYLDEAIAEFDKSEQINLNKNPQLKEKLTISPKSSKVTQNKPLNIEPTRTYKPQQQIQKPTTTSISTSSTQQQTEFASTNKNFNRLIATAYGLYLQGKYNDAKAKYIQALEIEPNNPQANYELANLYQDTGDVSKAEELYTKIISLKPNFIDAYKKLAFIKATSGEIQDAIKYYEKIISIEPSNSKAYYMLGKMYNVNRDYQKAKVALDKAVEIDNTDTKAYKELATVCKTTGQTDLANTYEAKSLQLTPQSIESIFTTAEEHLRNQNYDKATVEYKKILLLEPNNQKATVGLSKSLYYAAKDFLNQDYYSYA
ncbi:MAG: tetratricopeptide repeat protein, partial [Vampirovibrionia bacterium]